MMAPELISIIHAFIEGMDGDESSTLMLVTCATTIMMSARAPSTTHCQESRAILHEMSKLTVKIMRDVMTEEDIRKLQEQDIFRKILGGHDED